MELGRIQLICDFCVHINLYGRYVTWWLLLVLLMLPLLFQNLIKDHFGKILGEFSLLYFMCFPLNSSNGLIMKIWNNSNFSDVFDEEYFIQSLANDVKIVKKLPKEFATATKAVKHFISWSGVEYYQGEIARLWDDYQVCVL